MADTIDLDALERAAKELVTPTSFCGTIPLTIFNALATPQTILHLIALAREAETLRGRVGELEAYNERPAGVIDGL